MEPAQNDTQNDLFKSAPADQKMSVMCRGDTLNFCALADLFSGRITVTGQRRAKTHFVSESLAGWRDSQSSQSEEPHEGQTQAKATSVLQRMQTNIGRDEDPSKR